MTFVPINLDVGASGKKIINGADGHKASAYVTSFQTALEVFLKKPLM
jgi:hypothetical protein